MSTLTIDAGGSFILSGAARGTSVSVLSSDIAIGATASIGSRVIAARSAALSQKLVAGSPSSFSISDLFCLVTFPPMRIIRCEPVPMFEIAVVRAMFNLGGRFDEPVRLGHV